MTEKLSAPIFSKKVQKLFSEAKNKWDESKMELSEIKGVSLNGKPAFVLTNILTKEECEILINSSEESGFQDAKEYCHLYKTRLNDRLMCDDKDFSELLWQRTKKFLPTSIKKESKKWNLSYMNERWRFCKYTKGHYFGPHVGRNIQLKNRWLLPKNYKS